MAAVTSMLFCLLVGLSVIVSVISQQLNLFEGDSCKEEESVKWYCKLLSDCPTAQEDLKERNSKPQICGFKGFEIIVCCDLKWLGPNTTLVPPSPPSKDLTSIVNKVKEMCKEYAEAVYIRIPSLLDDEDISYDTCAWKEPNAGRVKRIVNGTDSVGREFPHMALIGYQRENRNITWRCGGSLISDRFILSGGDCAGTRQIGFAKYARLGDYNVRKDEDEEMVLAQPSTYEIVESYIYSEFNRTGQINDIALFKLNASVLFTEFIRPICLQTDDNFPDTYAVASGWGATEYGDRGADILKKVNLTIVPATQCKNIFKNLSSEFKFLSAVGSSILCAGGDGDGKDACGGDGGGPLQVRLKEPYCMYSQIGITSLGFRCGEKYPGLYTKVSHYIPWIQSIVWP